MMEILIGVMFAVMAAHSLAPKLALLDYAHEHLTTNNRDPCCPAWIHLASSKGGSWNCWGLGTINQSSTVFEYPLFLLVETEIQKANTISSPALVSNNMTIIIDGVDKKGTCDQLLLSTAYADLNHISNQSKRDDIVPEVLRCLRGLQDGTQDIVTSGEDLLWVLGNYSIVFSVDILPASTIESTVEPSGEGQSKPASLGYQSAATRLRPSIFIRFSRWIMLGHSIKPAQGAKLDRRLTDVNVSGRNETSLLSDPVHQNSIRTTSADPDIPQVTNTMEIKKGGRGGGRGGGGGSGGAWLGTGAAVALPATNAMWLLANAFAIVTVLILC